jgi:hypothetical protein
VLPHRGVALADFFVGIGPGLGTSEKRRALGEWCLVGCRPSQKGATSVLGARTVVSESWHLAAACCLIFAENGRVLRGIGE